MQARGKLVHGEIFDTTATSAQDVQLYDTNGDTFTLASNQRMVVTDAFVSVSGSCTFQLFGSTDASVDAGELILGGELAANGHVEADFQIPRTLKRGAIPRILLSAGNATVVVTGYVLDE